eukprot:6212309-Pleurochrysis_carterae.AAC.2
MQLELVRAKALRLQPEMGSFCLCNFKPNAAAMSMNLACCPACLMWFCKSSHCERVLSSDHMQDIAFRIALAPPMRIELICGCSGWTD